MEINEILPKSLYNASITLAPKSNKNATKKKLKKKQLYTNFPGEHIGSDAHKILVNLSQKQIYYDQEGYIPCI